MHDTTPSLASRRVILAVSGGIAAYKAPALVRTLTSAGAEVRVILSRAATQFVAPLALQAVSHNAVGVDLFDPAYEAQIGHIELARWADVILIAPATAHTIAKLAHGLCDDLLSTVVCASAAPVVVAPAMNTKMLLSPMVQANIQRLQTLPQYQIIQPDTGVLACQETGPGRMPDPPALLAAVGEALTPADQPLEERHVLVTAGPTVEPIDPVRFITNRSSGKMGFAIARAASMLGARCTLIAGPCNLDTPPNVTRVDIESAADMFEAVFAHVLHDDALERPDVVVKAAAVADWTPTPAAHKLKKGDAGDNTLSLPLSRTRDILKALGELPDSDRPFLIGFAAETREIRQFALDKLHRKGADIIVGNNVLGPTSAFGADRSSAIFFDRAGRDKTFGPDSKDALALALWSFAREAGRWPT